MNPALETLMLAFEGQDAVAVAKRALLIGAGWGFLSDVALGRCPGIEHHDPFEAGSRALDRARINLARFSDRTGFHWHVVTTGQPGACDAIVFRCVWERQARIIATVHRDGAPPLQSSV